ncbi:hypothetical protein GCM10017559_37500 [Streptosporangium longisporum]|uniref:Uncharacterized protein n=1 Tax=Streptosporangium longisporum TaxID=46187 RepID=A0ABP6KI35_9ACTN
MRDAPASRPGVRGPPARRAAGDGRVTGGGYDGPHVSFPSRTVGLPRRKVATTRPGSVSPSYGVLRLLEA